MATAGKRVLTLFLAVSLVAGAAVASRASSPDLPGWLMQAPPQVREAILSHRHKSAPELLDRLGYTFPDGTLGVMVRLAGRTDAAEDLAEASTAGLRWYGKLPAFYARVDQIGLARLLGSPHVLFAEPDYPITNFLSTAAVDVNARSGEAPTGMWSYDSADGPYGALESDIPGFSPDRVTGKGVVVADTDSGIDGTHRDFGGWGCKPAPFQPCESRIVRKVVINQVVAGDNDESPMPTTDLASGHGTHTAGIIAGNGFYARTGDSNPNIYGGDGFNFGIAPQASLISVKLGDSQSAALGTFGLEWQLAHARKYDIRVSNNSWGCKDGCSFDHRSVTAMLLKNLYEAGVLVTFSAGNNGVGTDGSALNGNAQSPYVLGVAAYDDEQEAPTIASFSSRGREGEALPDPTTWTPQSESDGYRRPDLSAPGVSIYSAANLTGGTSSILPRTSPADADVDVDIFAYTFMSGTSMAAPMVSGAAALLFGACPAASTLDVMRALKVGAQDRPVQDTEGGQAGPHVTGYGGLDVRASFDWLATQDVCRGGEAQEVLTPVIEAPQSASVGRPVSFDGSKSTVAGGAIAKHKWDFGDGKKASGALVSHSFKRPGTYEVALTVESESGASATRRKVIEVSPKASFTASAVVREGSYFVTGMEFIAGCPRMPVTQGLDGYVFTLPEPVNKPNQVATLSAETGTIFASVFSEGCISSEIAYSEGGSDVTVVLPRDTLYVVAMVEAPLALDIDVDIKVHKNVRSNR